MEIRIYRKESDKFGLRLLTMGFTQHPLHHGIHIPISKTQKSSRNLTGKSLFIHYLLNNKIWGLFIGFTKDWFPDITDVVLKKYNKKTTTLKLD